ncbi:MAG: response regulator [Candidatus Aenigmatarchaeota archaeon]
MKKKVMIVDDEENMVELVRAILEKEGFEIISAYSGKECLEKLKEVKPDLILMDIMMPGITGKETVKKIRENPKTKDIKVIFLTVVRLSEIGREELKELKAVDYITKPFENKDLVERVKRALK